MFNGIVISKADDNYRARLEQIDEADLPAGDVSVDVDYSTLNYKDALAITGASPVVRNFPLVPGIDLVGTVSASETPAFPNGSKVILNGWGVGEKYWGGLAQKARLKSDWLIPLPAGITPKQAMSIGTAGYTAMLCVMALEEHGIKPEDGEILVTGAAGGVGSVAIPVLSKLGYTVVALSGRPELSDYLKSLGASEILPRSEMSEPGRPLAKERWAGVIDVVGSHVLANACASTRYGGAVAACGLAGGMDFPATVAPFILRGVTLRGVDSVMCPRAKRLAAWQRLAEDFDLGKLDDITTELPLDQVIPQAEALLKGQIKGRIVVDVNR